MITPPESPVITFQTKRNRLSAWLSGKSHRTFTFSEPHLSGLSKMSNYSEFFTNEDDLNRPFKTNRNRARILAIAVFTQPWHILFHKLIGLYFQAKLKPEELKKVVSVVYSVSKIDYLYASFQLLSVPKK